MSFCDKNLSCCPTDRNINELHKLAVIFRRAIIQCEPTKLYITLQNFPRGACGDAALLLAKYLENNGYGQFDYVLGNRDGHRHAWIQQKDLIIDITADQFEDQDCSVIVSYNHMWHSSFLGKIQHVADLETYDSSTKINLIDSYNEIVRKINT